MLSLYVPTFDLFPSSVAPSVFLMLFPCSYTLIGIINIKSTLLQNYNGFLILVLPPFPHPESPLTHLNTPQKSEAVTCIYPRL